MEKKNLTKAYIYIIAFFAIGVAISNIISFFSGVGIALIGASVLVVLAVTHILKDESIKKRFGDIFMLIVLEFLMLIVLYFAFDFNVNGIKSFALVLRNICAIYSMFALGYVIFRYISELSGKTYKVVEYLLGNYVPEPKQKKVKVKKEKKQKLTKEQVKKNKELENGTLAPKPSSIEFTQENVREPEVLEEIVEPKVVENIEESQEATKEEINSSTTSTNTTNRTGFWY